MTLDVPPDLWKKLTSTVGLVSVRHEGTTNVMSAEWSYFVNKTPLYAAVVLGPRAATRGLIASAGQFSLTFCSQEQAELADFAGSFSLADIDKTSSALIRFGEPEATRTPWVTGGLLAVECVLRQTVEFPVHIMYVGEVIAAHLSHRVPRPLVKHGAMHALGDPVERTAVVAAAQLLPGRVLRVAATGPGSDAGALWRVSLLAADSEVTELGEHPSTPSGDLLLDLPLPAHLPADRLRACRVKVERNGAKAGYAGLDGAPR
ncbi:flavin reductase family protein [Streptomyces sp. GTA36]